MSALLLSIIVTNYNYGRYLPRLFASLKDQGELVNQSEVIVVDDGSSDDSLRVAAEQADGLGAKFTLVETPRKAKPGPVRNAGLAKAGGEYLICLDADDFLAPEYFEACHEALGQNPGAGFAYPDSVYLEPAGNRIVPSPEYERDLLLNQNYIPFAVLMRREIWDAGARYRDNTGYEDWDFWIQAVLLGFEGIRVPKPLYYHHRHGSGYFDKAVSQDALSKAAIVLNNRNAFAPDVVSWAGAVRNNEAWALGIGRGLIPGKMDVARLQQAGSPGTRQKDGLSSRHGRTAEIRQHSLMQSQGGAARVADLLCLEMPDGQGVCSRSWEVADRKGQAGLHVDACHVGASLHEEQLTHVHSSKDWAGLLKSLTGRSVVATVHDERLLTGGCPYHLKCANWHRDCRGTCPVGIEDAAARRSLIREHLLATHPLLIAPSGWMARQVRQTLPELTCRVVPNGVPWPETMPDKAATKQTLGLPPESAVIMFAAHGGAQAGLKGGKRWQGIWDEVMARVPSAVGFFVGGEKFEQRGNLTLWPYLPQAELYRLMAATDVLAYPTLADNHPLVVLEAFSRAVAVVAFDVGGLQEQIAHGKTGLLTQSGNWKGLTKECIDLLAGPERARRLGREAYVIGKKKFTVERMVKDHVGIYKRLVQGQTAG